jgi:hypothetical protein
MTIASRTAGGGCSFEGCGSATPNLALLRVFAVHFGVSAFKTHDVFLTPNEVMTLIERESRDRKTVAVYELSEAASGVNRPAPHEVLEAEIIHGRTTPPALLGCRMAAPAFFVGRQKRTRNPGGMTVFPFGNT